MPEFIKDHIAAVFIVVGSVIGVFGIGLIQVGPPAWEWFIAGVVLCGIAALCFIAAWKLNPADPVFEVRERKEKK